MPRFANGESGRKSQSDTIQKMKRQLATAISRHATLQHENQQLHQEHQLLQAVCGALDWLRQQTGEDEDIVSTAEELLLLQQVALEAASPPAEAPDVAMPQGTVPAACSSATAQPAAAVQQRSGSFSGDGSCSAVSADGRPSSSSSALPAASQPSCCCAPTAAPADDVMLLFRRVLSMPLTPNVDSISIAELQSVYVGFVKELSLASQLYEAATLAGRSGAEPQAWLQGQAPVERMEDTMCRFLQLFVSLFKVKRQGLVQQLCLTHLETGQLLQEPVQEHYTWVMPQLGLTPEQQQRIATGVRVFKRILTPSLLELRQLQLEDTATTTAAPEQGQQQQQHNSGATSDMQVSEDALHSMGKTADSGAATAACSSQDPAAAAAGAAAAGSATLLEAAAAQGAAMSADFAPLSAAHVAYRQRLDEQERRSARISVLLRKDFLHRICFCAYVYGCLSWPQQAKLHCLMWPYSPMVLITSETIAQMAPQGPPRRPRGRPRLHPLPE